MSAERPPFVLYEDAIRSDDEFLRLKGHTLGAVAAMVPTRAAGLIGVTRRRTIEDTVGLETCGPNSALAGVCERFLLDGRGADPFGPQHVADSDATVLALHHLDHRAAPYRWWLRTLGLGDRVTMYVRSAGTIVAMVALARSVDEQPFTSDELLGLRRIQPLIERAYLCAVEPRTDPLRPALLRGGLSSRETEIVELVGRGATNAEIARSLYLSEATVKTHLTHVFAKTGVRTRTQLALLLDAHFTRASHG